MSNSKVKSVRKVCHHKGCNAMWDTFEGDPTKFCFMHRSEEIECQSNGIKEMMDSCGSIAHGEVLKQQNAKGRKKQNMRKLDLSRSIVDDIRRKNREKKNESEVKSVIIETEKKQINNDQNEQEKTLIKTKNSENIMQEVESNTLKESLPGDMRGIQPLDSKQALEIIKMEQLSSIKLLNNSGKHLLNVALSLTAPVTVDEVTGEVLKRSTSEDIETSIKCFEGLNSIMKTKLDYLKFASELRK